MRAASLPAFGVFGITLAWCAWANEPALTVTTGGNTVSYAPAALLALPSAATLKVPNDVAYKRDMTFQAVPVAATPAQNSWCTIL